MNEARLQEYLLERYPKENAACEWKEFKNLRHALVGSAGSDVISYLSAIANMEGGHLVIGVEDSTLRTVGIQDFNNKDLILDYLRKFGSASPHDLKRLVLDKLSDALDEKQKQNKFRNLLNAMSLRYQTIEKQGSRQTGRWVLSGSNQDKV
ncbi:ATP-binding protein [Pseudomonas aeruginosa]|uniref:AlbA family DNA-binding domain-containing protein n=1 Tax=Pseudomonas aeruginosa TaxID=287 RepID=UPI00163BD0B5|nr:ATP-binding protein [Pseudomonas aeruginosa]MCS9380708.1 ATP-binding protein [Pseudomonas aeruginosa]MDP5953789.1 ATP-binding protein [Pseudomonas aeruginosa]MDP5959192.1 ATP-binding protein [Pseudomonas aeruginosa]HCL4343102.1 putative DNA binding domain-containing protein [Pseudomonas aeruginosa]